MRALLFCLGLAATQDVSAPGSAPQAGSAPQQGAPVPAALPAEASPEPSAPPYEGSFSEGMRELRTHARAGEYEQALALADGLLAAEVGGNWRTGVESATGGLSEQLLSHLEGPLEWLGVSMRTSADRAEVHYARGFVLHELARHEESRESFGKARMLAGPGPTRLDAVYDLGTSALLEGEEWRAKIPEISGAQNPPVPGAPSAGSATPGAGPGQPLPGAQPPAEEDPLARAKAAYLGAREHLLERLRSDWQDADSRANVELALRRLRELEEIERQRKEQQQQQEQQPKDQKQDSKQNQDQDQKPGDQEKQDQPKDEKSDEKQDKPPEPKPDESQPDEPSKDESKEEAGQPEEHELTKEEVQRLLDRLAEHEKEGEEVHQRLQRLRRVPVKRDW